MLPEIAASLGTLEQVFPEKGKEIKQHFESVASELSETGQQSLASGLSLLLSQVPALESKPGQAKLTNNKEQISTPEPLCWLSDVSCIYPRGVFALEFSEEAMVLRGKSSTVLLNGQDVIRSQILEQDALAATVLVRVKESPSFPSGVILLTLKGKNAGKAKAVLNPGNENRNALREPLLSTVENESSSRLALFGGFLYLITKERVKLAPFNRKLFIKCNIKSVNEGKLFLLDDCIVFVGSPLTVIDKSKAESCALEKSNSRMYEMHVKIVANENQASQAGKNSKNNEIEFSQISVEDVSMLQLYLQQTRFGKHASSSSVQRTETGEGNNDTNNNDEQEQQSESEDSDSMSSDDSPYTSDDDESSDDTGSEGGEHSSEANGNDEPEEGSASEDEAQTNESKGEEEEASEEGEEQDSGSSESSSDDDDSEEDDPNLAEIVDEEPLEVDPSDIIASGKKRRRTIAMDQ